MFFCFFQSFLIFNIWLSQTAATKKSVEVVEALVWVWGMRKKRVPVPCDQGVGRSRGDASEGD